MDKQLLDIILFGASGYTGKYCIKEIHRLTKSNGKLLTWGVAGRSETKLKTALHECQKQLVGEDLSNVPIIIANIEDSNSLRNMTSRAKVIINCCGPYRFYGEPVVKACLETGTHQVDVTGEPQYIEYIQLKYHEAARKKGIYIVSSCGFDCIPGDLGVIFLQQNFQGILNSIETYLHVAREGTANKGPGFNYATWESLVHGIADAKELSKIRRELYAKPMPKFKPQMKPKPTIHKSDVHNGWAIPFVGADRSVIYRTQRYLYENENVRPAQIQTYEVVDSLFTVMAMAFYAKIFSYLVKSKYGQQLLLKNPALFSGGMFSHKSPSAKAMENTKFSLTFRGEGWDENTVAATNNNIAEPPNKTVIGYVSGYNPAYKLTGVTVTLAAITIITETEKLPKGGGVYSPGAAFAKTSLLQQLQSNGLDYKIKSKL